MSIAAIVLLYNPEKHPLWHRNVIHHEMKLLHLSGWLLCCVILCYAML